MLASTFIVFLIEAALIIALGRLLFDVARARPARSRCSPCCALGAAAFAAMGLGADRRSCARPRARRRSINVVYLPMAIISGTFFTPKEYPAFLRAIADVLPLTHFTELTRDVMVRDQHVWSDCGALAVVARLGRVGLVGRDPRLPLAAAGGLGRPDRGNARCNHGCTEPTMAFAVHGTSRPRSRCA